MENKGHLLNAPDWETFMAVYSLYTTSEQINVSPARPIFHG